MELGLFAINYGTCADPANAVRVARHAEAAGFESVWTGEHIALPTTPPPGFTISATLPFLDTIVALTLVAAHTSTIRIGSGIIELPLHQPVLLAKQLASVDHVSRGRLIVGVGAGYVEAEFAAMGVSLSERGQRMDEHLAAMRAMWTMDAPELHGRFVDVSGVDAHPRPVQPGGPPIVLGGVAAPVRRRAITQANGWYLFNTKPHLAREAIATIRAEMEEIERPAELGPLELTFTPSGRLDRGVLAEYEELGADRLVVLPRADAPSERRHEPVVVDDILRTIDAVAAMR